jgi:hypothetical protein
MSITLQALAATASAVIALIALFRPEISRAFRRSTNDVELTLTPRLEVGFGSFGPTINVLGSLRAIGHDQFVSAITLTVVRAADHLRREFVWAALLPPSLFLRPETAEIAAGFSLSVANAHRFNVQFHDPMAQERVDAVTDIVRAAYLGFLQNNKIWLRDIPLQERWVLYERFGREVAAVADARTSLDRIFYWEPGRYNATLTVSTTRPSKSYLFEQTFSISVPNTDALRSNVNGIVASLCAVPDFVLELR